jgi:phosphotriesterase-related protein
MAAIIRTTAGDRPPEEFGIVLFHEHIHYSQDFLVRLRGDTPAPYFHLDDVELMESELIAAHDSGVTLMVDGGHNDMGRDIGFIRNLAERTGMPVVLGGGFYLQKVYSPRIAQLSEEELVTELLTTAAEEGWGVLGEIGSSGVITQDERKVFRAVAAAHRASGLSIFTHTEVEGLAACEQLDIFEDAGADLARVVIGHLGGLPDTLLHERILAHGANVGFDRVSRGENDPADDLKQARQIAALVEAGWLSRIFVSGDQGSLLSDLIVSGGPGYAKPWTVFAPILASVGLSQAEIRTIFVDNPLRLLAFSPR